MFDIYPQLHQRIPYYFYQLDMAPNNDNNAPPPPPPAAHQQDLQYEPVQFLVHNFHPQQQHPLDYYNPANAEQQYLQQQQQQQQPLPPPPQPQPPVRYGNDPILQEMLRMPYGPMYAALLPEHNHQEHFNRPQRGLFGEQLREFYVQQNRQRLAAEEQHISSTDDGLVTSSGYIGRMPRYDPVSSTGIDAEEVVPPEAEVSSSGIPLAAADEDTSTERCSQQVAEAIADILEDCPTAFTGIQEYLRERDALEAAYEMDDAETETEDETSDWMYAEENDEYV